MMKNKLAIYCLFYYFIVLLSCGNSQDNNHFNESIKITQFREWISGAWDRGTLGQKYEEIGKRSWGDLKIIPNVSIIFDLLVRPSVFISSSAGICTVDEIVEIGENRFKIKLFSDPSRKGVPRQREVIIKRIDDNTMTVEEIGTDSEDPMEHGFWIAFKDDILKKRDGYTMQKK